VHFITTLGRFAAHELGPILPHEHVVADLRPLDIREPEDSHPIEAIRALIEPEVRAAKARGITAIVDATPEGVGRRSDAVEAISHATGMPFALATGVYREPWVPSWIREASITQLVDWMTSELEDHIRGTATPAAWIKLSAGDDGMTLEEERILRAAAQAGVATGAAIGSHTTSAAVVERQLDVLESMGFPIDRFIWIHAQAEPELKRHRDLARRGCWVEYDWVGLWPTYEDYVRMIGELAEAGFTDRILLSQDCGWYEPGEPGLGRGPYTRVHDHLLPLLRASGFDDAIINAITVANPFWAFARP
jgi:phosphotriesterase-related protein